MEALGPFALGSAALTVRPGVAAQVAPFVAWLCSPAAHNVNGRTFLVAGDEIGLYAEPSVVRCIVREGGWNLDALDAVVANQLTTGLENQFLLPDFGPQELPRLGD